MKCINEDHAIPYFGSCPVVIEQITSLPMEVIVGPPMARVGSRAIGIVMALDEC